jgi:ABC-type nitrate/sulfonate/bicarbonate transport system substrate-binding protein
MRSEAPRKPVFAIVSPFASHSFLLCKWLKSAGIDPEHDVRITVLPPALVGEHMKEGHIDGFCVGEPWNSASALAGDGWIAATSATLDRAHPEKVLLVSDDLRVRRSEEYALLRQAVLTACRHCETADGRAEAVELLHSRRLFTVDRSVLANSLIGPLQKGPGQSPEESPAVIFSGSNTNRATRDRALWMLDSLGCSPALSLDGPQRRACLDAVHDVELPRSISLKSANRPRKASKNLTTS